MVSDKELAETDFNARMDALEQSALNEITLMVEHAKLMASGSDNSLVSFVVRSKQIAQSKNTILRELSSGSQ